ncbi:MAG: hypothetical protein E6R08_09040 [Nevskiaceae bacterium]|nr:MAG: hypothetical protein E6R08_09040 [Nevskiaceae bacterium]
MPFEHSGAVWRVLVPLSKGKVKRIHVHDHEHGSAEQALQAAKVIRDTLALGMPFPITAMLIQYMDGSHETQLRFEPDRRGGPVWTATYLRLDEETLKPKKAILSRSVAVFGDSGARQRLLRDWEFKVWEGAIRVDQLVRQGVPVLHHF